MSPVLFEEMRPQLTALAYRMLGTRADAEDIVQEAFLRWNAVEDAAEIRSPKSYLNSIVARLSLDALKSARRKRETYVGSWLPEPAPASALAGSVAHAPNVERDLEMADTLSLAFLHVLESLSPQERVAFLMRDVFAAEYAELADALGASEANCRQLVTRARQRMREKRPRFPVDPDRHQAALREFVTACVSDDKSMLLGILSDDAVLYSDGGGKVQAALNPIHGADRIARFFLGVRDKQTPGLRVVMTDAGGVPALGFVTEAGVTESLLCFDLNAEDGRVQTVFVIRNPDKLTSYR